MTGTVKLGFDALSFRPQAPGLVLWDYSKVKGRTQHNFFTVSLALWGSLQVKRHTNLVFDSV